MLFCFFNNSPQRKDSPVIISSIDEEKLTDVAYINTILNEVIRTSVSDNLHTYFKSITNRKEMLNLFGNKAFLLPAELKFPVINPESKKLDCKLIYAARLRIKQHPENLTYRDISSKADLLYKECKCTKNIQVYLKEHNHTYDLLELLDILNLDFSLINEESI